MRNVFPVAAFQDGGGDNYTDAVIVENKIWTDVDDFKTDAVVV